MKTDPSTIIDSSVLIDCLRGRREAVAFLDNLRNTEGLFTHAVAIAEVMTGARDRREQRVLESFFADFRPVHITESDSALSLELLAQFRLSHGTGWLDCLIAATCLRLNASLVTLNEKHFSAIPALRVVRPY